MKNLHFFIIFTCVLFIQGCVAAAVVGTTAMGVKVATDPRTIGTQIDDNILRIRINNALLKNKQIKKKTRIKVITYNGKVLLLGQAPNRKLSLYAEKIAMSTEGNITEIYNEIRQNNPISWETILSDTWITIEIYLKLFKHDLFKTSKIEVITENSEVFLFGLITKRESKHIDNVVNNIKGVKRVVTVFTYI